MIEMKLSKKSFTQVLLFCETTLYLAPDSKTLIRRSGSQKAQFYGAL
jgi:hypothetical protein